MGAHLNWLFYGYLIQGGACDKSTEVICVGR